MEDVDGFGLRHVIETASGQHGVLDMRTTGCVVFTPDGSEQSRRFAWRKASVVGTDLLKFVDREGDVRVFREVRK